MFATLLPEEFAVECGDPRRPVAPLFPAEAELVSRAVEKRKNEFSAGRQCARAALGRLGINEFALLAGASREPLWPPGIVGSITHSNDFCAAAVGPHSLFEGVGIDVEPAQALATDLARRVASDVECARLTRFEPNFVALLVFSAKESFYKCQFYRSRRFLDFPEVEVLLEPDGRFSVSLLAEGLRVPPEPEVHGRWLVREERLFTAAWQRRSVDRSRSRAW